MQIKISRDCLSQISQNRNRDSTAYFVLGKVCVSSTGPAKFIRYMVKKCIILCSKNVISFVNYFYILILVNILVK